LRRIRHLEPVEISLDAVGAELREASLGEDRVHRVERRPVGLRQARQLALHRGRTNRT
jgi:hypothetical protein